MSSISVSTRYSAKFSHALASIETNSHAAAGAAAMTTLLACRSDIFAVTSTVTRRAADGARLGPLALAASTPTSRARCSVLP